MADAFASIKNAYNFAVAFVAAHPAATVNAILVAAAARVALLFV